MVAIALYRGNLHRVPNAPPRRWPAPPRSLSAGQFKSLLRRRSVALSRIAGVAVSSSAPNGQPEAEAQVDDSDRKVEVGEERIAEEKEGEKEEKEEKEEEKVCDLKDEMEANDKGNTCEKLDPPVKEEISKTDPAQTEREERKKELEKKLEDLNQKKHNLVQMLKQILYAEEEIKRRSLLTRAQGPMENGHLAAVRLNVDVNFNNHDLVGESDPGSTQSAPTRPFYSPSPSSLSRSPFVHIQRGQLGHATSLPPLLPLPGNNNNNNYVGSSPPPAASGGTSVFRDNSRFFGGPN
ncbi:hypothetical protein LUZ60_005205 [Juncus effusus]|nr:hypothetical protein LUZ60_005205 [Juncus effusus]